LETNLNIEEKDLVFIKDFLKGKENPVDLDEISNALAFFKTEKNRVQKVKIYSPNCEYKVGDLIYKEYPGKIPIGTKKYIELTGGVVLKVVEVRTRFKDEVKLAYDGTSDYKKYIDYLKRQKIELLLPHKQVKPCEKSEYIKEEDDPRRQYAPLLGKDFNLLIKKLISTLEKSTDIAFTDNRAILSKNLKPVDDEIIKKIRDFLKENGKAESTEFFVENFIKIQSDNKDFESYCFALNYKMHTEFKLDFQKVNSKGWGKWNLISVIYYLKKDSIISEINPLEGKTEIEDKKGLAQKRRKFEEEIFDNNNNRYFLSQREITSGALRLRHSIPEMAEFEEISLIDENTKKKYTAYYYSDSKLLMGMDEIYNSYKIIQGAIFTISGFKDDSLYFNIRITKKGTISTRIEFDKERKTFFPKEEKIASQVFVNKSMYLEPGIISDINLNIDYYRKSGSLNDLILKIFFDFGIKEKNSELTILQLYHILDLIYPIRFELVADIILGNSIFIPSEKLSGVFYLDISITDREDYNREKGKKEILSENTGQKSEPSQSGAVSKEISAKEEIKRLREERKKKREEEMIKKEQLERDRKAEKEKKFSPHISTTTPKPVKVKDIPEEIETRSFEKAKRKAAAVKKESKYEFKEKEGKSSKKVSPKPQDDQLDIEDIKSEIELLKLKDKVEKGKRTITKKVKKKEIAFKDNGKGLGGVFASKLDEIIQSEDKEKKSKKKTDKEKK